jgi:hypothetical protein
MPRRDPLLAIDLYTGERLLAQVTVGTSVTFAVDKNVAYIRNRDGSEHRLRIIKKIATAKR